MHQLGELAGLFNQRLGAEQVADAPAGHGEGLGQAFDDDRALVHAVDGGDGGRD